MKQVQPYQPKHKIRIVTAASLFDGHDAAINIMRRIIQATGVEVIHLGHDRSVEEVVNTAIQEDANAIAMTSYQGGHNEYFKYMYDLLREKGAGHIKDLWRRRRGHPARGDPGTDGLWHNPHLFARRWPRTWPAGHDQRPGTAVRFSHRRIAQRPGEYAFSKKCQCHSPRLFLRRRTSPKWPKIPWTAFIIRTKPL